MSTHEHKKEAPSSVGCYVLTVSDTRTPETDRSGQTMTRYLREAGHRIAGHEIVKDEPEMITEVVDRCARLDEVDVLLITGGTGIGTRDQTPEAVEPLLDKVIPGYGELFRMLSYEEIGAAAMLSRALAGTTGGTVVVVTPGSTGAVRLAMEKLIIPEIGHMVREARK